jgi:hypothetical protein
MEIQSVRSQEYRWSAKAAAAAVGTVLVTVGLGAQTFEPAKDGTLVDGGVYGPQDGVPDSWDWSFNESGYEGSITRVTTENPVDSRVVWEYDLSSLTISPPVSATLHVTLRGAPIFPFPDSEVRVYSYPADLQETTADFAAGPALLQGSVVVTAFQAPTPYAIDVSQAVNSALNQGTPAAAFRFQIDADAVDERGQAFIDALDSDPATKPALVIETGPATPGDVDEDGDVDLDDYLFPPSFPTCMTGPAEVAGAECLVFDFDSDTDVDEVDFAVFQSAFTGPSSQK